MRHDLLALLLQQVDDPITDFLTRDWAGLSGWGIAVTLGMYIILGAVFEWWVPGRRYRRMELAAIKNAEANLELTKQNGQLITSNEITKHFFEETVPKRGEVGS